MLILNNSSWAGLAFFPESNFIFYFLHCIGLRIFSGFNARYGGIGFTRQLFCGNIFSMTYKEEFIKFMSDSGVLTFGDFTLKSGRKAPYFINTGNYKTGAHLARLGGFYAECIKENNIDADVLFGPAYKGVPLAVSAAVALASKYEQDLFYCFDRKEAKDHGEGGMFVGKQLCDGDRVIIIEDVMTSGKALREVLPKLNGVADVKVVAMVITVDRMEKALDSELSAVQAAYKEFGIPVYSIVTINDIIKAIEDGVIEGKEHLEAMKNYRSQYGVNY